MLAPHHDSHITKITIYYLVTFVDVVRELGKFVRSRQVFQKSSRSSDLVGNLSSSSNLAVASSDLAVASSDLAVASSDLAVASLDLAVHLFSVAGSRRKTRHRRRIRQR
ncbi:hypothetical protein Rs2_22271 [Raphanus sativus]|nr:hypothetical protein Rs2_22271 [Raphanus sativus]